MDRRLCPKVSLFRESTVIGVSCGGYWYNIIQRSLFTDEKSPSHGIMEVQSLSSLSPSSHNSLTDVSSEAK